MNIGFLGFGTIGQFICGSLQEHDKVGKFSFTGIYDPILSPDDKKLREWGIKYCEFYEDLLEEDLDLLIEAASQAAAKQYIPLALKRGINVLSMSVGAYLEVDLFKEISEICAQETSGSLFIPSGALPSVDVLKAASLKGISSIELFTTKPPQALSGAPGVIDWEDKIDSINSMTMIFSGSAEEAIHLFPKNINISSTLSLVGLGAKHTRVCIAVDPSLHQNIHEITLKGDFGELYSRIACNPSNNPKTSLIAPLSAVSLILQLGEKIKIGS